jgi:adenylate cyclase
MLRGVARWSFGMAGWREDLDRGAELARASYPTMLSGMMWRKYIFAIPYGVIVPDATALRDTAETLATAEQSGDDLALDLARATRGVTLFYQDGQDHDAGLALLAKTRERAETARFAITALPIVDLHLAMEKLRLGNVDGAIEAAQAVAADVRESGAVIWEALSTTVLVEALLQRCSQADLVDADAAIKRLAALKIDPGLVTHEICLLRLRALLAKGRGEEAGYRDSRDRYRMLTKSLKFEGQMQWADAMR